MLFYSWIMPTIRRLAGTKIDFSSILKFSGVNIKIFNDIKFKLI